MFDTPEHVIQVNATDLTTPAAIETASVTVADISYHDYVLNRALTLRAANPTAAEFAPFSKDGRFSINAYMRAHLRQAGVDVAEDQSYRDWAVNRALASWHQYATSPEFAPYIRNNQFYLADYMRGLGLVTAGTDRADLTLFMLYPPVNDVVINHADFTESELLVNENQQVNDLIMTDVIVENATFFGAKNSSLFNCVFTELQYNLVTWQGLQSISCIFQNSIRFSPPTFTPSESLAVNSYNVYAKVPPSSSIFFAQNTSFSGCKFSNFPLSNMYVNVNNFTNNTYVGGVSLAQAAGLLIEPLMQTGVHNGVMTYVYTSCLIIQEKYPDNMPCQNMSATLVLLDGTQLRGADFTNSTIFLGSDQKLNNVNLTGAIFTNATVYWNSQTYQGPTAIQTLFSQLGMQGSIAPDVSAAMDTKSIKGKEEPAPIKLSNNASRLLKSETKDKKEIDKNAPLLDPNKDKKGSKGERDKKETDESTPSSDTNNDNKESKDEPKRDPSAGMGKR